MGRLSEATIEYVQHIKQKPVDVLRVRYTKGGGSHEVDIAIRGGDDVEKKIKSVIGHGVEHEIIKNNTVIKKVEQDPKSQSARNEAESEALIVESAVNQDAQEVIQTVKRRGRPRKVKENV
jgi:hypothetical protein